MRRLRRAGFLILARPEQGVLLASAAVLALGLLLAPQRNAAALLLVGYGLVTLGLAGLLMRALQYATRGEWHPAIRRLPLRLAALLPAGAVLVALALVLFPSLWPWTAEPVGSPFKRLWLSQPFFLARSGAYLLVWLAAAGSLAGRVDATRGAFWTVLLGATAALSSFDWLMSLDPHWYSTLFGPYCVAGLALAGLAAMILLAADEQRRGRFDTSYDPHDAGTMLMGLSALWMYLWFSQYMLIWYANIPEETGWYIQRLQSGWQPLFVLNLLLNGALPFLVLMPRETKRSPKVLVRVASMILVGRWLDLALIILPTALPGPPALGFWEVNATLAAALLAVGVLRRRG